MYSIEGHITKHGGPLLRVEGFGDTHLLEDGGSVTKNWVDGRPPILIDPPENAFECLRLRKAYWEERCRRIVAAFAQLKRTFLGKSFDGISWESHWGPAPSSDLDNPATLKHLAKAVRRERARAKKIFDLYDNLPEVQARRERQERAAQAEQERAAEKLARQDAILKIGI